MATLIQQFRRTLHRNERTVPASLVRPIAPAHPDGLHLIRHMIDELREGHADGKQVIELLVKL